MNKTFLRFILVGIINTIIGTSTMFIAYNLFSLSYWISTFLNYFVGSIVSFILNKFYTFKKRDKDYKELVYFVLNIIFCYTIAYSVSLEIIKKVFSNSSQSHIDNYSMLGGMILFVLLNYFGQKYWVFKKK